MAFQGENPTGLWLNSKFTRTPRNTPQYTVSTQTAKLQIHREFRQDARLEGPSSIPTQTFPYLCLSEFCAVFSFTMNLIFKLGREKALNVCPVQSLQTVSCWPLPLSRDGRRWDPSEESFASAKASGSFALPAWVKKQRNDVKQGMQGCKTKNVGMENEGWKDGKHGM